MKRREFITLLGGAAAWRALLLRLSLSLLSTLACLPLAASAQQAPKLPRLGWLGSGAPTFPPYEGFRQGLRELGYVEGKNIVIEARWAMADFDRLPALARELIGLNVDLLFVSGDQGLKAAKEASATIPIVVAACDPLDSLVVSIARPGGKATGLTCISSELAGKRLQVLQELVPALSRVAILYNPDDRNKAPEYKQMQDAARSMNLTLRALEARSAGEIDAAFVGIADHAQGLIAFLWVPRIHRCGRLDQLWCESPLALLACRFLRRQDFQGRESWRPAHRTADEIRAGDQPQDRQGARAHRAGQAARSRR